MQKSHITHAKPALVGRIQTAYVQPIKTSRNGARPFIPEYIIMAAIDFRPTAAKFGFSLSALIGTIAAWNDRRMTRASLNRLSARELDDIGLVRGDIEAIANGDLIR
ncbi:DUF1127 domain-containing protein [Pseudooctadecabacter sp.]|uniref:DUF1127 domain-containing protein n=1 Tax=Pseudooctadecabacter sp. TaxID=1966338 RepID=UPI0035C7EC71